MKATKLFISCPMRNRTDAQILKTMSKLTEIASVILDERADCFEIVNPYKEERKSLDPIEALGLAIQEMSKADVFVGVDTYEYRGCNVERMIAQEYGLKTIIIRDVYVAEDPDLENVTEREEDFSDQR